MFGYLFLSGKFFWPAIGLTMREASALGIWMGPLRPIGHEWTRMNTK
jgi:hypothetical protein